MNPNQSADRPDLIRDFITDRLNPSDHQTFKDTLESDPVLAEEVQNYRTLMEAMRQDQFKKIIAEKHKTFIKEARKSKKTAKSVHLPIMAARMAAVITLLLVATGIGYLSTLEGKEVAAFHLVDVSGVRAFGDAATPSIRLETAFKEEDYQHCLGLFQEMSVSDRAGLSQKGYVLLGNAAWKVGDFDNARIYFESALKANSKEKRDWGQDANYYLGLWHLHYGNPQKAKEYWWPIKTLEHHRYPEVDEAWPELTALAWKNELFGSDD